MDSVAQQLDSMTSHVSGMQAAQEEGQQRRARRARAARAKKHKKQLQSESSRKEQKEAEAEEEAAALLARARRLVDAAKGIELPDFSTLFSKCVLSASGVSCAVGGVVLCCVVLCLLVLLCVAFLPASHRWAPRRCSETRSRSRSPPPRRSGDLPVALPASGGVPKEASDRTSVPSVRAAMLPATVKK